MGFLTSHIMVCMQQLQSSPKKYVELGIELAHAMISVAAAHCTSDIPLIATDSCTTQLSETWDLGAQGTTPP